MRLLELVQQRCGDWQQGDVVEQLKTTADVLSSAFLSPNAAVRRAALGVMAAFPVQLEKIDDEASIRDYMTIEQIITIVAGEWRGARERVRRAVRGGEYGSEYSELSSSFVATAEIVSRFSSQIYAHRTDERIGMGECGSFFYEIYISY